MSFGRDTMTREDISKLKECPECYGHGTLRTPSKNAFNRTVTCGRCHGTGYVTREPAAQSSERAE